MSRTIRLAAAVLAASVAAFAQNAPAIQRRVQDTAQDQFATGSILVANEKLADPNFAESVVLILEHDDEKGTLGVIINRRTKIPITKIFPDIKAALGDPLFLGGPVGVTGVQALLKLPAARDQLHHVSGDIYATGSKEVIEASVRSRAAPSKFRLYAGYAGWAPGQLEAEISVGAWSALQNRPALVFDPDPDSLWSRLTRESHLQIAALTSAAAPEANPHALVARNLLLALRFQPGARQ